MYVTTVYRPPGSTSVDFITDLQAGIDKIPANNSICVVGDFNARHSTWWNGQATDEIGRALFDFASFNGLVQLVQGATRHPGGAAAAQLDLMFLNEIFCVQACTVLPQLSDHCPTLLRLNVQPQRQQTAQRCFLDVKNADFRGLNNHLSGLAMDRSSVLDAENSETAARNWHEILSSALQDFIPQKQVS